MVATLDTSSQKALLKLQNIATYTVATVYSKCAFVRLVPLSASK